MQIEWTTYDPGKFYDEMISSPGNPRRAAHAIASYLQRLSAKQLGRRQHAADLAIAEMGVTLSLIHISEPTRPPVASRMPSSA